MSLNKLKDAIYSSNEVKSALSLIKANKGRGLKTNGLRTSFKAFFIDYLVKNGIRVLYLSDNVESCEKLRDDLVVVSENFDGEILLPGENYPYCSADIDDERKGQRLHCLDKIVKNRSDIIISTYRNLFEKHPDKKAFDEAKIILSIGDKINRTELRNKMSDAGFDSVKTVESISEFAIRGSIIDIYPYSSLYPVRIEFFGDEIESIRYFDPSTQKKIKVLETVSIFFRDVNSFKENYGESSLFDLIDNDTLVLLEDCPNVLEKFSLYYKDQIESGFERLTISEKIEPNIKYHNVQSIIDHLQNRTIIYDSISDDALDFKFNIRSQTTFSYELNVLSNMLKNELQSDFSTFITCDNPGQAERFGELFENEIASNSRFKITSSGIHSGFVFKDAKVSVYTDHEIFGRNRRPRIHRKYKKAVPLKQLKNLNTGDYVVHMDHGIGMFGGLEKITVADSVRDVIKIYYKDNDVLYVKLDYIHMVHKYNVSDGITPNLSKLGGKQFAKVKERTKNSIKETARELIKFYALRKEAKGFQYPHDTIWQTEMESAFEFEDTIDQVRATEELKKDMESSVPMDRLVCGDVGFGKTEVAVRAAFKGAVSGKQVAVLAPTTILVYQHFQTFKSRIEKYPVKVDFISRLKSKKEQSETLRNLKEGKIDILIGTHRILSKDVEFKDLGLLVIDEEQRFGVTHKERIKELKVNIDVLTLTATPIPRTLHMSLMGVRDLSLINTPPTNRLSVITEIHPFNESIIFEAIMKEKDRGGQVYFLHNRVETIENVKANLERIAPQVSIVVAHGQMEPKKLENIMLDFLYRKHDVLLATTIIENGVDISNANTIIINNAHMFGLSQLYQLRGRIGRSHRQGYAYFLVPKFSELNDVAKKRLETISEFTDLGSGYQIAMKDLEIRGAGNLLGSEQSGFIENVGFELYTKILEEAVLELKREEFSDVLTDVEEKEDIYRCQVSLRKVTLLPEDYIFENSDRVEIYRKLMGCRNYGDIQAVREEVVDRFGKEPEEVINLFENIYLSINFGKLFCKNLTLLEKNAFNWFFKIQFDTEMLEKVENTEIALLLEEAIENVKNNDLYKIKSEKNGEIIYVYPAETSFNKFEFIKGFMKNLGAENL
ncbi:MAG: transcription-repair coupling factor [Candidatus Delongbacteria bacterium]|nr:transcription-repair coupling factor [Candidatus Delongbacteria bacterium]MBN2835898.1 transcription-repair coupling factor [Candidatus Delongbacteria bacterium]